MPRVVTSLAAAKSEQPPLKRSASTASLPTPPRTKKRNKRAKFAADSRFNVKSCDSGSDERANASTGSEGSEDELPIPKEVASSKKRVAKRGKVDGTSSAVTDDEDQAAFWRGPSQQDGQSSKPSSTLFPVHEDEDEDEEETIPVLERRLRRLSSNSSVGEGGLASPPPSHRKVLKPKATLQLSNPDALKTPPTRSPRTPERSLKFPVLPITDSPNNPFLETPTGDDAVSDDDEDDDKGPIEDRDWEPPTVTYVHRGHRKTFPNPYYNPLTKKPVDPPPNSLLPPEHEDYVPDLRCPPKVLWPSKSARRDAKNGKVKDMIQKAVNTGSRSRAVRKGKGKAASDWSSDEDLPVYQPKMPPPLKDGEPSESNTTKAKSKNTLKLDLMEKFLSRDIDPNPRTAENARRLEPSEEELLRAPGAPKLKSDDSW